MVTKSNKSVDITDVSVRREGTAILVPPNVSFETAIQALVLKQQQEEEYLELPFSFDMTVPEGALALYRSLQDIYGFINMRETPSFFGSRPPTLLTVATSPTEEVSLPWGLFSVPGIEGTLRAGFELRDGIPYFRLTAEVKGKYKAEVETLVAAVRNRTDSIYKGQSISLSFPNVEDVRNVTDFFPKFVKIAGHTTDDLIFSDSIQELVQVSLFTPIIHSQLCRENGIPLKRGVMLEGPYGVGKTMTASVSATLAQKHGWTFIHLGSASDLAKAYHFAKSHQPAIIFVEDLDETLDGKDGRDEEVNAILNALDGVHSKGDEIITVFTTNNIDDITQAMLRPGRIDTLVPVREPDAKAVKKLITKYAGSKLVPGEDLSVVAAMLDGKNAAVVREVVERSKLSAIERLAQTGESLTITAHDLEVAARGIEAHAQLLEPEYEDTTSDLEKAAKVLADALLQGKEVPTQRTGVARTANGHNGHVAHPAAE